MNVFIRRERVIKIVLILSGLLKTTSEIPVFYTYGCKSGGKGKLVYSISHSTPTCIGDHLSKPP